MNNEDRKDFHAVYIVISEFREVWNEVKCEVNCEVF